MSDRESGASFFFLAIAVILLAIGELLDGFQDQQYKARITQLERQVNSK